MGLQDNGYHVDAVDRRDDAIDQLKWYEYDVAIIDWRMPGAEGIDVVAWARRNKRPTALLMLTARDAPADRIRGLDTGHVSLNPVIRAVSVAGRPLNLTNTEYLILELLMRRSPAVVDRKAIAEHAWADETDPLGSNAIDVQMSRLRAKLLNADVRIVTVRGAGYRLEEA